MRLDLNTAFLFFAVVITLHNYMFYLHNHIELPIHPFFEKDRGIVSNLTHQTNATSIGSSYQDDSVTIFYNIYIPEYEGLYSEQASIDKVYSIIQEQLKSRATSMYPQSTLNYTTVGRNVSNPLDCENCFHVDHIMFGDEYQTLSKVHAFCVNNPSRKVAYIHNKGSYHPSIENDRYRRMLTKAVFSESCMRLISIKNTNLHPKYCKCNICGARFSPLPHFHMPGNMWIADCNYISKLRPPNTFNNEMENVIRTANKFGNLAEKLSTAFVGRERFSAEHWASSHPDICPCDVYPGNYTWSYENLPTTDYWKPDVVRAPRFCSMEDYANIEYYKEQRSYDPEGSWFSLAGRIHEWRTLYGKEPSPESWIWSFYNNSGSYGNM